MSAIGSHFDFNLDITMKFKNNHSDVISLLKLGIMLDSSAIMSKVENHNAMYILAAILNNFFDN